MLEKVYKRDSVEVIYQREYRTFEVWQAFPNGPDGVGWECVAETGDQEEAVAIAEKIWNKMAMMG